MKDKKRVNIWFERRHGRLLVGFMSIPDSQVPILFTSLGLGISYVTKLGVWKPEGGLEYETLQEKQRILDSILRDSINLRSLEVRASDEFLEYSELGKVSLLKFVYLMGPLADMPDLSNNHKLKMLAGSHKSLQNCTGLENLHKLKYVYVSKPKKTWLASLPKNITLLNISGGWVGVLPLGRFTGLRRLVLDGRGKIDFKDIEANNSVRKLGLFHFKEAENLKEISTKFPALRHIQIGGTGISVAENIKALRLEKVKIKDFGRHRT